MLEILLRRVFRSLGRAADMDPASGYDLWSSNYDGDGNLLVALEQPMFGRLLERLELRGRRVIDVGCGTGRQWKSILAREPAELVGYDVSGGMLAELRRKYPRAIVHRSGADRLIHARDRECDVVISTLTLCHVPSLEDAVAEWARVLRPGGDLLLTDFHPAASATSRCTFRRDGDLFTVKLHVHPIASLEAAAARAGFERVSFEEALVDESTRPYYERADMLAVFERMKGEPLVYGAHFRKSDVSS